MTKIPYAGTTVNRHLTQQERDNLRYVTARSEPHRIAKGLRLRPVYSELAMIALDYAAIERRAVLSAARMVVYKQPWRFQLDTEVSALNTAVSGGIVLG